MRMTRAALRAQESLETISIDNVTASTEQSLIYSNNLIYEDSDKENGESQASDIKSSDHEDTSRLALRDITAENYPTLNSPAVQDDLAEQRNLKNTKSKGKGAKGRKKKVTPVSLEQQPMLTLAIDDPFVEMASDESSESKDSKASSDVSEAIGIDESIEGGAELLEVNIHAELESPSASTINSTPTFENSVSNDSLLNDVVVSTTASLAELPMDLPKTPQKQAEHTAKTPRFDPEVHQSATSNIPTQAEIDEDSFVDSIKTRSPSKLGHHDIRNGTTPRPQTENTVSRPLSKASSPRVEDSVAALDDLEDALEKVSKELPAIEKFIIDSPVKARSTVGKRVTPKKLMDPVLSNISNKKPITPALNRTTDTKLQTSREKLLSKTTVKDRVKEFESKPANIFHRRATSVTLSKRMTAAADMPRTTKHGATKSISNISNAAKPTAQNESTPAPEVESKVAKKRVVSSSLSTSKPAFVPAKSTKPVTKSTFVLPGEAIAAKLRAQREERAKREEEATAAAANNKPQFKARPVPAKMARPSIMPRENRTSQARTKPRTESSGENKENVAPPSAAQTISTKTAASSRPKTESTKASSSARRTTAVAPSTTLVNKRSTINTAPVHRVVSSTSQTSHTSTSGKGKEVFERQRVIMENENKEKREKEEAAKRARAEAAERGRLASREWAEKQKKKLMEKTAAAVKVPTLEVRTAAVGS